MKDAWTWHGKPICGDQLLIFGYFVDCERHEGHKDVHEGRLDNGDPRVRVVVTWEPRRLEP